MPSPEAEDVRDSTPCSFQKDVMYYLMEKSQGKA